MNGAIIVFQNLSVVYPNGKRALDEISFSVAAGECFALVGESGCGKSTLARAALGILPRTTKISGSIRIDGNEIVAAPTTFLRSLRGLIVGFVAQDPFSACNPLAAVRDFVSEAWRVHSILPPQKLIENSLENLGIENARARLGQLPSEWSGGMLQRAGIAAAAAHAPKLIIADEPTSALDAELRPTVLEALKKIRTAILLISHDLALVEKYADRIAVIRDGRIVETGAAREIFQRPQNVYTKNLLAAALSERSEPPSASNDAKIVVEAKNLSHYYEQTKVFEGLNLQIRTGEMIGICGASGCGKSTLLRLLATIETPVGGEIHLGGEIAAKGGSRRLSSANARNGFVMPVFQDSFASLDRRWTIWRIVAEPLTAKHRKRKFSKSERRQIATENLRRVGLENLNPNARPTQLSIGQCQRIAVARALTAEAKFIAADEPTSSLDHLNGERVMRLFAETAESGAAVVVVSHDRDLLRRWCHRIFSMADGVLQMVEEK